MKVAASPMVLKESDRLSKIEKEYHTRRQNGKLLAYIVEDKLAQHLLLGQKLSSLAEYVNTHIVHDKPDQVSTAGLFQIISASGGRTGGWSKHRWAVRPVSLTDAAPTYESMRARGFENCVIVGQKDCYQVQCGS